MVYVEMHAALARAVMTGRMEFTSLEHKLRKFEIRWASMDVADVTDALMRRAADLPFAIAMAWGSMTASI